MAEAQAAAQQLALAAGDRARTSPAAIGRLRRRRGCRVEGLLAQAAFGPFLPAGFQQRPVVAAVRRRRAARCAAPPRSGWGLSRSPVNNHSAWSHSPGRHRWSI